MKIKCLFKHNWHELKRVEMPLIRRHWSAIQVFPEEHIIGQIVFEKCFKCGKVRAYTTDGFLKTKVDADYWNYYLGLGLDI